MYQTPHSKELKIYRKNVIYCSKQSIPNRRIIARPRSILYTTHSAEERKSKLENNPNISNLKIEYLTCVHNNAHVIQNENNHKKEVFVMNITKEQVFLLNLFKFILKYNTTIKEIDVVVIISLV